MTDLEDTTASDSSGPSVSRFPDHAKVWDPRHDRENVTVLMPPCWHGHRRRRRLTLARFGNEGEGATAPQDMRYWSGISERSRVESLHKPSGFPDVFRQFRIG